MVNYYSINFRLGFTEVIISDQGWEFVNKEFMALAGMTGSYTICYILVILSHMQALTTE